MLLALGVISGACGSSSKSATPDIPATIVTYPPAGEGQASGFGNKAKFCELARDFYGRAAEIQTRAELDEFLGDYSTKTLVAMQKYVPADIAADWTFSANSTVYVLRDWAAHGYKTSDMSKEAVRILYSPELRTSLGAVAPTITVDCEVSDLTSTAAVIARLAEK